MRQAAGRLIEAQATASSEHSARERGGPKFGATRLRHQSAAGERVITADVCVICVNHQAHEVKNA